MSNTKAKALIATATVSAIAFGTTVAKADTTEVVVEKPTATPTVAETIVTQESVSTAKSEYNTAQSNVDAQATSVLNAQTSVDSARQAVLSANTEVKNAENLVSEATSENISKTEKSISELNDEKSQAENSLKVEQDTIKKATEEKSKQEQIVKASQENVSAAQNNVNTAEEDVRNAKNILDRTGASEVIAKAKETQLLQDKAQTEKDASEKVLNDAKKHDEERQSMIDKQSNVVVTADNQLKRTTSDFVSAQKSETDARNSVTASQTALTKAQNDVNEYPIFYVSDEYVTALKALINSKVDSEAYNSAVAKLKEINSSLVEKNQFKSNAKDSSRLIELNTMSTEDQTELTQFANVISNQIRKAFGTQPTVITPMSIAFAKSVADNYVADDWSIWEEGHDVSAIYKAATDNGYSSPKTYNAFEDINSTGDTITSATMSELKEKVYFAFLRFMYNGFEWLHAFNISGLDYAANNNVKEMHLGVSLSTTSDSTSVHVINAPDFRYIGTKENSVIKNTYNLDDLKAKLTSAQSNFDNAVADYSTKQKKTESLKNQLEKDNANLKAETDKLTLLKQIAVLTPNAQKEFDEKVATLAIASEENRKAQDAVKVLNADIQTKKANLEKAQANLKTQEAVLKTVQNKLSTEQAVLKSITERIAKHEQSKVDFEVRIKELTAQITAMQGSLEKLKNAPTLLKQAQAKLEKANADLKDAEVKLKSEQDKLAELEKVRDTKKLTYEELLNRFEQQEETKRQVNNAKRDELVPVVDVNGKLIGLQHLVTTSYQSDTISKFYHTDSDVPKASTQEKQLPATGSRGTILEAYGLLTMFFGMGMLKRKRKN